MSIINLDEATREFLEKLEGGYFKNRYPESHDYFNTSNIECGYSETKEKRDADTSTVFAKSSAFKKVLDATM